jgi:hypothetical protein
MGMSNPISQREPSLALSSPHLPQPPESQSDTVRQIVMLSEQQEQVLEWLIGGGSISEAAEFAGITRRTISRWLHEDPDFRAVYDAWKAEANQLLEGRLIAAGEAAMDNILGAVRNRDVRASQFVIKALLGKKVVGG